MKPQTMGVYAGGDGAKEMFSLQLCSLHQQMGSNGKLVGPKQRKKNKKDTEFTNFSDM